jgi:hypothetical protein
VAIIDFGLGAEPPPKLVLFPLNALMLKVNFASGAAAEEEEKAGFKDIL